MVVCMKSAQVGWTDGVINNYVGRRIDIDPCPMIIMFPKEGAAKEYEKEKFRPMVEATDRIRDKVDLRRGRAGGNSVLFKEFPGGFLKLVGSNSPSSVKSTPAPVVIVEEPDDANSNVKGQGNTIKLLMERTKSYYRRKILYGGTPTIKGLSEVEAAYLRSDQRKLYVPCHHCDDSHVLDFDYLKCDEDPEYTHPVFGHRRVEQAYYHCPHCGGTWNDNERIRNIRAATWRQTAESPVPGFFINELYSPFPGSCHAELMRKWIEAEDKFDKGDQGDLIAFVNSSKGLPYEYKSDAPDEDALKSRALEYAEKTVPHGGLVITAGIDVQHDRLAIILRAWGRGEESWLVWWGELHAAGTTSDKNDAVWSDLDKLLFAVYSSAAGNGIRVTAAHIDSSDGGTNDAVYHYVRTRKNRGVKIRAVKGDGTNLDREIVSPPRKIDLKNDTKAARYGLQVYMVGSNKTKDLVSERLKLVGVGPGRMHWYQGVRPDYYPQLNSEVKAPHRSIRNKLVWQKKSGVHNEGFDCECYALHAARVERLHLKKSSDWDRIEADLMQSDLLNQQEEFSSSTAAAPSTMKQLGRLLGHGDD